MEPFIILDYTNNLMKASHLKNVPDQSKGKALKTQVTQVTHIKHSLYWLFILTSLLH